MSKKFTRHGYMTETVEILEKYSFTSLHLNRLEIKTVLQIASGIPKEEK